jgi:hypothetical protein
VTELKSIPDTPTHPDHWISMLLPKQENLALARELSVQALTKTDLAERAVRSGGRLETDSTGRSRIGLAYLGREVWVDFPRGKVEASNGEKPVSLREEILILHYLEKAGGASLTERWVSFTEISGGTFYHSVFLQRCKAPLVKHFGEIPARLLSMAADELRGEPWSVGDLGVKVQALPSVPLGLALWKGDDEFPPEGNVLFDSSISQYLSVEDIVVLAETVVWRLVKKLQA